MSSGMSNHDDPHQVREELVHLQQASLRLDSLLSSLVDSVDEAVLFGTVTGNNNSSRSKSKSKSNSMGSNSKTDESDDNSEETEQEEDDEEDGGGGEERQDRDLNGNGNTLQLQSLVEESENQVEKVRDVHEKLQQKLMNNNTGSNVHGSNPYQRKLSKDFAKISPGVEQTLDRAQQIVHGARLRLNQLQHKASDGDEVSGQNSSKGSDQGNNHAQAPPPEKRATEPSTSKSPVTSKAEEGMHHTNTSASTPLFDDGQRSKGFQLTAEPRENDNHRGTNPFSNHGSSSSSSSSSSTTSSSQSQYQSQLQSNSEPGPGFAQSTPPRQVMTQKNGRAMESRRRDERQAREYQQAIQSQGMKLEQRDMFQAGEAERAIQMEEEHEFRRIGEQAASLHELANDVSTLVHTSQEAIDDMTTSIESSRDNVLAGLTQLSIAKKREAGKHTTRGSMVSAVIGGTVGLIGGPFGIALGAAAGATLGGLIGSGFTSYSRSSIERELQYFKDRHKVEVHRDGSCTSYTEIFENQRWVPFSSNVASGGWSSANLLVTDRARKWTDESGEPISRKMGPDFPQAPPVPPISEQDFQEATSMLTDSQNVHPHHDPYNNFDRNSTAEDSYPSLESRSLGDNHGYPYASAARGRTNADAHVNTRLSDPTTTTTGTGSGASMESSPFHHRTPQQQRQLEMEQQMQRELGSQKLRNAAMEAMTFGEWVWDGNWHPDISREGTDSQGWEYAFRFAGSGTIWYPGQSTMTFVRRRRWVRKQRLRIRLPLDVADSMNPGGGEERERETINGKNSQPGMRNDRDPGDPDEMSRGDYNSKTASGIPRSEAANGYLVNATRTIHETLSTSTRTYETVDRQGEQFDQASSDAAMVDDAATYAERVRRAADFTGMMRNMFTRAPSKRAPLFNLPQSSGASSSTARSPSAASRQSQPNKGDDDGYDDYYKDDEHVQELGKLTSQQLKVSKAINERVDFQNQQLDYIQDSVQKSYDGIGNVTKGIKKR